MSLRKITILILSVCVGFSSVSAFAAKAKKPRAPLKFPHGCREVGQQFDGDYVVLRPVTNTDPLQTLYLMHNVSNENVQVSAEKRGPFPLDYKNKIGANGWGVFVMDEHELVFHCAATLSDDEQDQGRSVSCNQVLQICQYSNAKFAEHNGGTYWAYVGETMSEAVKAAIDNGILLRW